MPLLDRLRALVEINRAIVASLDYDEVLRLVMDKVATFSNADRCVLLLADGDGLARIKASRGLAPGPAAAFSAPLDERIDRVLRELMGFQDGEGFIAVPVLEWGAIRGILAVVRRGPQDPLPDEEYLLAALADQAAIALDHAARFQAEQRRSEQKSRLLEAIHAASRSALAYVDGELRFGAANAAYGRLAGDDPARLIGRCYAEVIGDPARLALIERARDLGEPGELLELAVGERFWDWYVCPVPDQGGVVLSATEVTDRVRARRAAEDEAHRKDEFLGMLSHELRNPLMPICNSLYILERVPPASEEAIRSRRIIARQIDHLVRLIDDLLDVTRITRGKIELTRVRLDLNDLVQGAVLDHRPAFAERGLTLEHAAAGEPLPLDGDATRLAQVVGNLLQNAAKFTPPGGRVWVGVERDGDNAVLRVRDTGIGIPAGAVDQLFVPFAQLGTTLDRSGGGLGLGLALVRGLVTLHGGSVHATSDGSGRGAEFVVSLPLAPSPPAAESPAPVAEPAPHRCRVLVVEDNIDGAHSLALLLSLGGHEVTLAHTGPDGVARARELCPDLVLCDIGLPGLDGYGVARAIRADPALAGVGLVSLSGYGQPEDLRRSREAGFERHLIKPADLEAIQALLDDFAPGRRARG